MFVRNELITSIKKEMNLDLEMNQLIDRRRAEKKGQQLRWENLEGQSRRVQNALDDIMTKTAEILEL